MIDTFTRSEFESALDQFASFERTRQGDEHAYDIPLPEDSLVIRVISTVDVRSDASREKGSDSIKVVVWDKDIDGPIGGREYTTREPGWSERLQEKVTDLFGRWRNYSKECPCCSSRMVLREPGRNDDWDAFWGCSNYPRCDNTEQFEG